MNNYTIALQGGVIFKGRVSINNGKFSTDFIVPKDISYENKNGKIIAYVFDNTQDGVGFTKKVIIKLNHLLEISNIIENYLVTEAKQAGKYYGPTTGIFYWSHRQLNNFQEMLERNLTLINDITKN